MTNLFRNSSRDALTLQQSFEREKKRSAERRKQMRQARELAAQGRGNDTEVAHVALGELVVPQALQNPEVLSALQRAAARRNVSLDMLRVGSARNHINPKTGSPEFGVFDVEGNFGRPLSDISDQHTTQLDTTRPADADSVALDPLPKIEVPPEFQNQGLPRAVSDTLPHRVDMISALQNPRVLAGLDLIRHREGGALDKWTGGERYPMPTPNGGHPGFNSDGQSAAGLFQIQKGPFNDMQYNDHNKKKRVGPMDFNEPDQYLATTAYLDKINALGPLRDGDIDEFLNKASVDRGWASLPPNGKQDRSMSVDQAKALYNQYFRNRMVRP